MQILKPDDGAEDAHSCRILAAFTMWLFQNGNGGAAAMHAPISGESSGLRISALIFSRTLSLVVLPSPHPPSMQSTPNSVFENAAAISNAMFGV